MKKALKWVLLIFLMYCTVSSTFKSPTPFSTGLVLLIMWVVGYWIVANWKNVYTKYFGEGETTLKTIYETRGSLIEQPVYQESVNGSASVKQLTLEEEFYLSYLMAEFQDKDYDPPIVFKSPTTLLKERKLKRIQKRSKHK